MAARRPPRTCRRSRPQSGSTMAKPTKGSSRPGRRTRPRSKRRTSRTKATSTRAPSTVSTTTRRPSATTRPRPTKPGSARSTGSTSTHAPRARCPFRSRHRRDPMTNREFHLQRRENETNAFHRVLNALPHEKWDYTPHEQSQSAAKIVWTLVGETEVLNELIDKGEFTFGAPPEVPPAHLIEKFDKAWDTLLEKIET